MILFRTAASAKTGFGHLNRSAYLASQLKHLLTNSKAGPDSPPPLQETKQVCDGGIFFCVNSDKAVAKFLQERNIPYCLLKNIKSLKEKKISCIVFDLREFTPEDFELLEWASREGITTIQVTDLGLSQCRVDYTIDASIDKLFPYEEGKNILNGPAYTLLHQKFRHFNKLNRHHRKSVKYLLVSLGGGVQYRRLRKLLDLLTRHQFKVKVAAGFYLKKSHRKILTRIYPQLRFVGKTDNLARAFYEADAAVITAGMAAAEAAAVGTPALYFHYHNEQKFIAESFEKKGAGLDISNIDELLEGSIVETLNSLTLEKRIQMGHNGKKLVDGLGAQRLVDFFKEKGFARF